MRLLLSLHLANSATVYFQGRIQFELQSLLYSLLESVNRYLVLGWKEDKQIWGRHYQYGTYRSQLDLFCPGFSSSLTLWLAFYSDCCFSTCFSYLLLVLLFFYGFHFFDFRSLQHITPCNIKILEWNFKHKIICVRNLQEEISKRSVEPTLVKLITIRTLEGTQYLLEDTVNTGGILSVLRSSGGKLQAHSPWNIVKTHHKSLYISAFPKSFLIITL